MMRDTALLVIDMQRDFCDPRGYAAMAGLDAGRLSAPIPAIARLTEVFRAAGLPVIYTREGHRPDLADCTPTKKRRAEAAGAPIGAKGPLGRLLVRGEYGHDIIGELAPEPSDIIVDKPGYSAFHATDLDLILRTRSIKRLVFTGVTTDVCVHSTLRSAIDRGYDCVTVSDGTACDDPTMQDAMLRLIAGESGIFGAVASAAELCAVLARQAA